ncbi:hypothetical protein [Ruminiclostridium cellobioparum]|jgi:hypothetical protein|uniref:hypothetical protein n=1 Tax=Ruminiclostridium cellobioparum TaxID=29355 RepID=UPI000483A48F|nr:hypothetical protein [Ruminiclostridium cellobioparum]
MPNDWSNNPYMHMMNLPQKYEPMMEMPQEQLESMFPRCYYIIFPEVSRHCDRMISKKGTMYTPTREELENIVDDIDNRVGHEVEAEYEDNEYAENPETMGTFENFEKMGAFENFQKDRDDRQFGFGGGFFGGRRRFRRDLVSIILLRELLRRRRRPFRDDYGYGYPGGYGFY